MSKHTTDTDYQDFTVTKVEGGGMQLNNGLWTQVPKDVPVKVGMVVRRWPAGNFSIARGLMVGLNLVYYRTTEEEKIYQAEQLYGKNVLEWLARWDAGQSVWSISMGGFGPGYEQCIQVLAVEIVRHWLEISAEWWSGTDEEREAKWKRARERSNEVVEKLDGTFGFTGAQVGAARNLARNIYCKGPIAVMEDPTVEDRRIQVSRDFPVYVHKP